MKYASYSLNIFPNSLYNPWNEFPPCFFLFEPFKILSLTIKIVKAEKQHAGRECERTVIGERARNDVLESDRLNQSLFQPTPKGGPLGLKGSKGGKNSGRFSWIAIAHVDYLSSIIKWSFKDHTAQWRLKHRVTCEISWLNLNQPLFYFFGYETRSQYCICENCSRKINWRVAVRTAYWTKAGMYVEIPLKLHSWNAAYDYSVLLLVLIIHPLLRILANLQC